MADAKKAVLTSLLGKQMGLKLYDWLNPCCNTFCEDVRACVPDERPYRVYTAILEQNDDNNATAIKVYNSIIDNKIINK